MSSRVVHLDDGAALVIGRVPTSDLAIDDDAVSRRHAMVRRRDDEITIEDLESRNGTLILGAPIRGRRRLSAGDAITIGPITIVVATSSAARRTRQIATIGELEDRLEAEVDRAVRYHRPLALVMLRFEGPSEAIAAHVERVSGQLRRMDLVAEYGDDELGLVLPETDEAGAMIVAQRSADDPEIAVEIGIATFPTDGVHGGELVSAARARLRIPREPATRGQTLVRALGKHVVIADPQMTQVYELAKRVAPSPIAVLVVGETGVGKEMVAEAIHQLGPRAAGPYVRLDCASLSESLVESELFGHEPGAFTGALGKKPGFFEVASGGTLFLDEIGELPASTQAKLLRALETRRIVRVGGTAEVATDVRVVCATHRDLEAEVHRGRFRQDLLFRIGAFVIPVPPLRDRRAEIPLLAAQFARDLSADDQVASISPAALAILAKYDWPGNVRELRNVIERALVLSGDGRIEPQHFTDRLRDRIATSGQDVRRRVASVEREAVRAALAASDGNQTHAARQLGISRFALIRLMDKHDLKR